MEKNFNFTRVIHLNWLAKINCGDQAPWINIVVNYCCMRRCYNTEVESLRTSLASRTNFEVFGLGLEAQALGLEAYKSSKMSCFWLEGCAIFCLLKKENNQTKDNITAVCQFVVPFLF